MLIVFTIINILIAPSFVISVLNDNRHSAIIIVMFNKLSAPFLGFLQATGLVVYIGMLVYFFTLGPLFSGKEDVEFFGPILALLLFVLSAVISALLVLGRAGVLFWNKAYRQAFTLLGWTLGWGLFYFVGIVLLVLQSKL